MAAEVINATISHAPISFVTLDAPDFVGFIGHAPQKLAEPLPLVNGKYLYVYNALSLRRTERYLATVEYRYWYQATPDENSWIFRYEYLREPPPGYPYAPSHLHVNGRPATYTGPKPFPQLHLPAGDRVTIEAVVRHLIAEHGVDPISERWDRILSDAESHFREIQRKRFN